MTKLTSSILIRLSNHRLLLIALVVSLLTHFTLLSTFSINVPIPNYKKQTLNIQLTNSASKQTTTSLATKTSQQLNVNSIDPSANEPKIVEKKESYLSTLPQAKNSLESNQSQSIIEDTTEPTTESMQNTQNSQIQQVSATEYQQDIATVNKPNIPTYRYVEIEYEIVKNNSNSQLRETFNIDKNGSYTLTSLLINKDSNNNITGSDKQRSEGTVGEYGLIPGYYSAQDGTDVSKSYSASFVWQEGLINLQQNHQNKIEQLLQGSQDLLSYKYQFMFVPITQINNIPIADGKELKFYTYQLIGEETISTNLGNLKSLHLSSADNNERNDIWLALDYQRLPIKISQTNSVGTVTEQIVHSIATVNR